MIAYGSDIDIQNEQEKTPLHICSEYGKDEVVDILIDEGANIEVIDEDGNTPLHLVCSQLQKKFILNNLNY